MKKGGNCENYSTDRSPPRAAPRSPGPQSKSPASLHRSARRVPALRAGVLRVASREGAAEPPAPLRDLGHPVRWLTQRLRAGRGRPPEAQLVIFGGADGAVRGVRSGIDPIVTDQSHPSTPTEAFPSHSLRVIPWACWTRDQATAMWRAVVLTSQGTSESPGGLLQSDSQVPPPEFLIQ